MVQIFQIVWKWFITTIFIQSETKNILTLQRPPADESSELLYSSLWTTYDGLKQLQNSLYFSFYM